MYAVNEAITSFVMIYRPTPPKCPVFSYKERLFGVCIAYKVWFFHLCEVYRICFLAVYENQTLKGKI